MDVFAPIPASPLLFDYSMSKQMPNYNGTDLYYHELNFELNRDNHVHTFYRGDFFSKISLVACLFYLGYLCLALLFALCIPYLAVHSLVLKMFSTDPNRGKAPKKVHQDMALE